MLLFCFLPFFCVFLLLFSTLLLLLLCCVVWADCGLCECYQFITIWGIGRQRSRRNGKSIFVVSASEWNRMHFKRDICIENNCDSMCVCMNFVFFLHNTQFVISPSQMHFQSHLRFNKWKFLNACALYVWHARNSHRNDAKNPPKRSDRPNQTSKNVIESTREHLSHEIPLSHSLGYYRFMRIETMLYLYTRFASRCSFCYMLFDFVAANRSVTLARFGSGTECSNSIATVFQTKRAHKCTWLHISFLFLFWGSNSLMKRISNDWIIFFLVLASTVPRPFVSEKYAQIICILYIS